MKKSTIFMMVGFFFLLVMFFFHEQVHVQIYRYDGIEAHIEWFSNFPDAVTIAERNCVTEACRIGHNVNEAISYVLVPVYILIYLGLLSIIGLMEKEK